MSNFLGRMPQEIHDEISKHLDTSSIHALLTTSKILRASYSEPNFRSQQISDYRVAQLTARLKAFNNVAQWEQEHPERALLRVKHRGEYVKHLHVEYIDTYLDLPPASTWTSTELSQADVTDKSRSRIASRAAFMAELDKVMVTCESLTTLKLRLPPGRWNFPAAEPWKIKNLQLVAGPWLVGAPVTASMIGDLMASISSIFKDRAVGLEGVDIAYLPNVHDIIPALAEKSPGLKRMWMEVDFDLSASGAGTDEGVLRNVPEIRAKFPELETLMLVFEDTRRDFAFLPPREIRIQQRVKGLAKELAMFPKLCRLSLLINPRIATVFENCDIPGQVLKDIGNLDGLLVFSPSRSYMVRAIRGAKQYSYDAAVFKHDYEWPFGLFRSDPLEKA